jgi:UDP-glucose 4-epimerase
MIKKILITGSSGFIGEQLVKFFLKKNYKIYGLDKKLNKLKNKNLIFYKINLSKKKQFDKIINKLKKEKIDSCWHLAANSDISKGINNVNIEIDDTFLSTVNTIYLSKKLNIKKIIFSSSSAIYGEINKKIKENSAPLRPISNYGAMKLSSESILYASKYSFENIYIFRFPNVVGPKMTHGLLYDLKRKLSISSFEINILGDGSQRKPYIHVFKLIEYMYKIYKKTSDDINVYNIGPNDKGIKVSEIVSFFTKRFNLKSTKFIFQNKRQGWIGDVVEYSYDSKKLIKKIKVKIPSSQSAINQALEELYND